MHAFVAPPHRRARVSRSVVRGVDDDRDEEDDRTRRTTDAMRRTDSLTHIEQAMSSVKSLRGRGLDLPNTPRWLRRKHRCARGDEGCGGRVPPRVARDGRGERRISRDDDDSNDERRESRASD